MKQRKELFASFIKESKKADLKLNIKKKKDHGIWTHHFMAKIKGKVEAVTDFIFLGSKITQQMVTAATKLKDACPLERNL